MGSLRDEREKRGWSHTRLASELRRTAKAKNINLPKVESLARNFARWENGGGGLSDMYRDLFCEVYGKTPVELGIAAPEPEPASGEDPGAVDLAAQLSRASAVDAGLVELLKEQTNGIRRLDARQGAQFIRDQAKAHLANLDDTHQHVILPGIRRALSWVLADTSALAGWQALDVGALNESWRHFERAKAAAREAQDPALLAFASAEQAYVLFDMGEYDQAAALVQATRDEAKAQIPRLMASWLAASEAEVRAAAGDDRLARQALDEAYALHPGVPDVELPYVVLNAAHLARWRGSTLARLGDPEAITELSAALDETAGSYARAETGLRVDLATALLVRGELDTADEHLKAARILSTRIGSARQQLRIARAVRSRRRSR